MAKDYGVDFSEISSTNPNHMRLWQYGMETARTEIDPATLKTEFLVWADANKISELDIEHFSSLPTHRFLTIGRAAWLTNNGAEIPETWASFVASEMDKLRSLFVEKTETEDDGTIALTNDARKVIQYVNLYSYIDAVSVKYKDDLDELEQAVITRIKDTDPAQTILRKLFSHYKENLDDALTGQDNEMVAATIKPLATVVNLLAASTGNAKAMAAIKKKVGARAAKAASRATVKIVDDTTNIVGLSPVLIVGNSAALIYNTKNRKLMLYVAKEGETLGIKGTYIAGFDEAASFGKTLRKPKETFSKSMPNVKSITKILSDYIAGKRHDVNGKLNKETLIVKVFK